jgi:hypothetical protein
MHWQLEEILEMEHDERRLWATEVSAINQKLNEAGSEEPFRSWVPDL